jgi:AraC family transcriptional regulator of adaptative response / DNA-3-methyladenine glycosylase II
LAAASPDALGQLGIVKQRQKAIGALAQAVVSGTLQLSPGADLNKTLSTLLALPGLGDWTAQYIAMRALRWPDAFPSGDVALHKALGLQGSKHAAKEALAASQAWQPWRSYAVIRAWAELP